MGARLALEASAARLVGRLSRAAGRGGGTTLPGKLVWKLDPAAVDALAARLPQGVALVSATNGKTTTTAMASSILAPTRTLAWNNSGANLASGVASTLLDADGAELGLLEVDEFALPEVMRRTHPRVVLPRQPLPRPARPLRRARARRRALARRGRRRSLRTARRSSSTPTIRWSRRSRDGPRERAALRRRRPAARARPALQHAADSKYCLRCGTPYALRRRLRRPPRRLPLPERAAHARPPLDVAARDIELRRARRRLRSTLDTPDGERARRARPSRASTTSTTRSRAASLALALGVALDDVVAGLERVRRRVRALRAVRGRRPTASCCCSSRTRPARTRRCARSSTGGAPALLVVALNDRIADGRDVSWIWDVDFEPLLAGAEHDRRQRRRARRSWRCASSTPGSRRDRLEVVPDLERGARPRARADADRRRARSSSRPTPRCSRCGRSRRSAGSRDRTGSERGRDHPRRPSLSRVPQHLRRPRQHRRASRAARPRAVTS